MRNKIAPNHTSWKSAGGSSANGSCGGGVTHPDRCVMANDHFDPSPALRELRGMTCDWKRRMGDYLVGIQENVPNFFSHSGILMNAYEAAHLKSDGGCKDLAAMSGEFLKPWIADSSYWTARNIRIGNIDSPGSLFGILQHNAVVVYPKKGEWVDGYVFDPWTHQRPDDPVPVSRWLAQHAAVVLLNMGAGPEGMSPVWIGPEGDIGVNSDALDPLAMPLDGWRQTSLSDLVDHP